MHAQLVLSAAAEVYPYAFFRCPGLRPVLHPGSFEPGTTTISDEQFSDREDLVEAGSPCSLLLAPGSRLLAPCSWPHRHSLLPGAMGTLGGHSAAAALGVPAQHLRESDRGLRVAGGEPPLHGLFARA